jgi:hypothetical protein
MRIGDYRIDLYWLAIGLIALGVNLVLTALIIVAAPIVALVSWITGGDR